MTDSSIPPLRPRTRSVSIEVAAHLERLIATGELAPGSRLPPERELAATLAVSRTSLREAMHELEAKHLVERHPGIGTTISLPSNEQTQLNSISALNRDIDAVLELRQSLEPHIAGFAALRATPAGILQLREIVEQPVSSLSRERYIALDAEFHLLLATSAQNPLFATLGSLMTEWSQSLRGGTQTTAAGRRRSAEEHAAIYEAVARHDVAAASETMATHLAAVRERAERATRLLL